MNNLWLDEENPGMSMTKINIAIDGPGGAGKTTIGKLLANQLDYRFLDSGLLYRHFARFCQKSELSMEQSLPLWQKLIETNPIQTISQLEKERDRLATPDISILASQLATFPKIRQVILHFQRELTKNKGWIVVGRDITSEVLPTAETKIFLTASLAARVKRRGQQYSNQENPLEVEKELQARDQKDQNRKISPLRQTPDSLKLDTTDLSPTQSVEEILSYIRQKPLK